MIMTLLEKRLCSVLAGAVAAWTGCGTSPAGAPPPSGDPTDPGAGTIAPVVAPSAHSARAAAPSSTAAAPLAFYGGGPVLSNVRIASVLWGNGVNPTVAAGIGPFYAALTSSAYLQGLDEYRTPSQAIGNGLLLGSFTIHPTNASRVLADDAIATEIAAQIQASNLPRPDPNTLYAVHFPPGTSIDAPLGQGRSCQAFCAYHFSATRTIFGSPLAFQYAILPDFGPGSGCDAGCGSESMFQNFTSAASHEVVEAITDPQPFTGWSPEIADPCNQQHGTIAAPGGGAYTVQRYYSNEFGTCLLPTCATDICEAAGACTPGSGCTLRGTSPAFADSSNAYEAAAANHGWIAPCSLAGAQFYCPASGMTRGELATVIIRAMFGEAFSFTPTPYFSDVPATDWRFPYIQKLRDLGITTGTTATTFAPDVNATRGQAAVFVIRAYALVNFGGIDSFTACSNPYFTDEPPSDPFYRYVQELRSLGITIGTAATTYAPAADISRESVAVFAMRAFDPAHAPDRIPVACP